MTGISVVIATFNRAEQLRPCLDALARQTAGPESFEVVVVDDGSTDETAAMLREYRAPFRLRVERQANRGPGAARNRGIDVAAGTYCLFMDDDILAEPELVSEHLTAQRAGAGVVGIGMLGLNVRAERSGLARYFAAWWEGHYRRFESGEAEPSFWDCFSGNMSAPRDVLRSIGGFDESLERTEDVELGYRLAQSGLKIVYLGRAAAEQHHGKGFREIVRDYDRAGSAALAMWRRHPALLGYAPLGDFAQGGTRVLLLRRLLLAARAPVWPIAVVDRFLARRPSVRLYAFLQLYCFWRGLRGALEDRDTWLRLTRGTVILMYHAIGGPGERASRFVMPARRFRRQLSWMRWRRRPVLTLDEYLAYRGENRLPPARSVVITLDDGYADNGELAAPILRSAGMPATVFVVTAAVGESNSWDGSGTLAGRRILSWPELRRLGEEGFALGAHTATHPDLTELAPAAVEHELAESRAQLERELGEPVRHFAYPYGECSDETEERVRDAGFESACGIEPGPNGGAVPLHRLRRMEVWGTRSLPRFALDLWLGRPFGTPREVEGGA